MTGDQINKLLELGATHALYEKEGKWYHQLKRFPGILFDSNGYVLFATEADYISHPALQIRQDLHVIGGISQLPEYRPYSAGEQILVKGLAPAAVSFPAAAEETVRVLRAIDVILRKKHLADRLKKLYQHTCQLCATRLQTGQDSYYAEVHHIIALGNPHNGPDQPENMVCVCPNCHVLLDLKAIPLEKSSFKLWKHELAAHVLAHHNALVALKEV